MESTSIHPHSPPPCIVIVGAGIAGLAACAALVDAGAVLLKEKVVRKTQRTADAGFQNVIVLEAEARIGGRINSIETQDGTVLELGANWLHYTSTQLYKKCDELNLVSSAVNLNDNGAIFSERQKPVCTEALQLVLTECARIVDQECNLHGTSSQLPETFNELVQLEKNRIRTLREGNHALEFAGIELGERIVRATAGAPTLRNLSCVGLQEETGDEPYRNQLQIPLGEMLEKVICRDVIPVEAIRLNCQVHKISFVGSQNSSSLQQRPIKIEYKNTVSNTEHKIWADNVIFTASVGVLKAALAHGMFYPALSLRKQRAIELFGFGNMGKIFFKFPARVSWWLKWKQLAKIDENSKTLFMSMVYTEKPDEQQTVPSWTRDISGVFFVPLYSKASQSVETNESWCFIMISDLVSHQVDLLSDEQVLKDFNVFMKYMTGDPSDTPDAVQLVRRCWSTEPDFLGTYSYCSVECAREFGTSGANILAEPEWMYSKVVCGKRFPGLTFAGEATYTKGLGYMHGAYETGLREASRLIAAYRDSCD